MFLKVEKMNLENYWFNQVQDKRLITCNHHYENTFLFNKNYNGYYFFAFS